MTTSSLLILAIALNVCHAKIIDTNATLLFTGSDVTCDSDEACTIYCDEYIDSEGACSSATINCPSDHQCDIWCSASRACQYSTIYCPLNGDCNIYCIGENGCESLDIIQGNTEATLVCSDAAYVCRYITFPVPPPNKTMQLSCGTNGCQGTTIRCPANAECDITCENC